MDIPDELKPFVNDYKMNLIEARNTKLLFHSKNNRDLFSLFQLLYDKNGRNKKQEAIEYADSNNVDESVILAISSIGGVSMEAMEKKGEISMCTFFEELEAMGEARGEARGAKGIIELGCDFGLSDEDILKKLQEKLHIPLKQARKYMEMFGRQPI